MKLRRIDYIEITARRTGVQQSSCDMFNLRSGEPGQEVIQLSDKPNVGRSAGNGI